MSVPNITSNGYLPPGIHAASLDEVIDAFGSQSPARRRHTGALSSICHAASRYEYIKRVLVWGSFASAKPDPRDLDYSLVVAWQHDVATIFGHDRRYLVPSEARQAFGVDVSYVV